MALGVEVGLGPGHIVLDGDPPSSPRQKGVETPNFSHFCCGQTARWTKIPLGMEVGLGPDDFTFDGDPVPPRKKSQSPPNFWPMAIVAKGLDG